MLQHPAGVLQVPLGEVQRAQAAVGRDRCGPSAFPQGEAERLLPVALALGEGAKLAQGPRQPGPGLEPQVWPGRARHLVRRRHALLQQRGRPAEVAAGMVDQPQAQGGFPLQGAVAERRRQLEGLLARCDGVVEVSRHPEGTGYQGQHPSQPSPVVKHPGQGLGLAKQGEALPTLSQGLQRVGQCEAKLEGQLPGVADLGQVGEGLEGLLEAAAASRNAARSWALAPACWQYVTALAHTSPRRAWYARRSSCSARRSG